MPNQIQPTDGVATPCCGNAIVATRLNTMQLGFPGVETPGYQQASLRDEYRDISKILNGVAQRGDESPQ